MAGAEQERSGVMRKYRDVGRRDGNSLAEYASEASERVFSLSLENLSEASCNGVAPSFERARKSSLAPLASDASETRPWYRPHSLQPPLQKSAIFSLEVL